MVWNFILQLKIKNYLKKSNTYLNYDSMTLFLSISMYN